MIHLSNVNVAPPSVVNNTDIIIYQRNHSRVDQYKRQIKNFAVKIAKKCAPKYAHIFNSGISFTDPQFMFTNTNRSMHRTYNKYHGR